MMRARRLSTVALTTLGLLVGVLACGVAAAGAANLRPRELESAPFSQPSTFQNPTGVAVDQTTGNVYVADSAADVVNIYGAEGGAPAGGVPSQITGLEFSAGEPEAIAVDNACYYQGLSGSACAAADPANGDVYVAESKERAIVKYRLNVSSHEYELVETLSISGEPNGVAVDENGDVYIANYSEEAIVELDSSGAEVGRIEQHTASSPAYVAVGAVGVVYVGNYEGGVVKLEVNAGDEVESEVELDESGKAVAVDSHGDVYVDGESSISVYGPSGTLSEGFGSGDFGGSQGVAVNDETGYLYISNPSNGSLVAFGLIALPNPPRVNTGVASSITPSSATISGSVTPGSVGPVSDTTYLFQYGLTTSYGSQSPLAPGDAGEGESPKQESMDLAGLEPGTTYHYRIVASNDNEYEPQTAYGEDQTFTTVSTPPILSWVSVSGVTQNSASIAATLDPQGLATRYELRLGATQGALETVAFGNTSTLLPLVLNVRSLSPGTVYYYKLTASNPNGSSPNGSSESEGTFTTASAPARVILGPPVPISFPPGFNLPPSTEKTTTGTTKKMLTRAQKLAKALKVCRKKPKRQRASCERQARKKVRHQGSSLTGD